MITIKAFHKDEKGLYTSPDDKKFYFEIGKTYIHEGKVEICESGFHASRNCDISETLSHYPANSHYCLVDINVVDKEDDKVVGDKITILKELTLEECIEYDKTGEWCYRYAMNTKGVNIELLQDAVISKDTIGEWCYQFALDVKNANIELLQDTVIAKDKIGKLCLRFAIYVKGTNLQKVEDAIIKKDKAGDLYNNFIQAKTVFLTNKEYENTFLK